MQILTTLILLIASITIVSCSGGGSRSAGGNYCKLDNDATFGATPGDATELKSVVADEKTTDKDFDDIFTSEVLAEGKYWMDRADFMYIHKLDPDVRRRWPTVVISEVFDDRTNSANGKQKGSSDAAYVSFRNCVSGFKSGDEGFEAAMAGLESIQIEKGKKVSYTTRTWGFKWVPEKHFIGEYFDAGTGGQTKASFGSKDDASKYSSPKKVFEIGDVEQMTLIRMADITKFRLYTRVKIDDSTSLYLRVLYSKTE